MNSSRSLRPGENIVQKVVVCLLRKKGKHSRNSCARSSQVYGSEPADALGVSRGRRKCFGGCET